MSDKNITPILDFSHVATGYGDKVVIKDVSLRVNPGEFIALIGSNGTGKSTLIKCLSGLLPLLKGNINIAGHDQKSLKPKERAQIVAVVPQSYYVDYDFFVEDIVMMGRNPYNTGFRNRNVKQDEDIVKRAMEMTNTEIFRGRMYNELSGGERQRVVIARAIAQQPQIILLDEPTSALDVRHATEIMELIAKLNKEENMTVMAVIHDINMAAHYCSRIVMLKEGYVHADGTPDEIVNRINMEDLYRMKLLIKHNPLFDKPEMVPIRVLSDNKVENPRRIHFICGDESAVQAIEALEDIGHKISAGVISTLCSDGEMCSLLGIPMVTVDPFCQVTGALQDENLKMMADCDYIVIPDMPFGPLNIENLRGIENLPGKICIHENVFNPDHDYTEGKSLQEILDNIKKSKDVLIYSHNSELELII